MFSTPGAVSRFEIPHGKHPAAPTKSDCTFKTKLAILPNRGAAVFGSTWQQTVMRCTHLNSAIGTMRAIAATGMDMAQEVSMEERTRRNQDWDSDPLFTNCPEIAQLKKRMDLPLWWDRVELSEFHDDNVNELALLAATDLAPNTVVACVGGTILPKATTYTIRLANNRHLKMDDGIGNRDSVFSYINHSFSPNVRCIPRPDNEQVVFETLRFIPQGETLSFNYTTTEEPIFASPFVDAETGMEV